MNFAMIMYEAHSGWRYIIILAAIVTLIRFVFGWLRATDWTTLDRWLGVLFVAALDIQFLLGAILWILLILPAPGANPTAAYEHPITMIIAVAIAHIGWSRARRSANSVDKFRVASVGFIISSAVLAVGIARITGVM